jgi:hypothetical protein
VLGEREFVVEGRDFGIGGGESVAALLSPNSRADRRGVGGGASIVFWRDGRLGSDGGGSLLVLRLSKGRPLGADTVGRKGRRGSSAFAFLSGNGGSVAGSYSGALTRFLGY